MSKLEGQYAPTPMQSIMGEPLRSEQRTGEILPRVLSRVDMLVIFITIVLFIPNVSVVCATGVGSAIYVWTHKALGPLWGFFAGFCAWFPVILAVLAGGDTMLSLVQGIGVQLFGANTGWLAAPWQQGIFVVAILIVAGW